VKTMTSLLNVEAKGKSVVVSLPGDKVAGTTDPALGQKLLDIFAKDPEHCLVNLELDKRNDKLWVTGVEYVEAPEELGGPPETATAAASTAEEAAPVAAKGPTGADLTLDDLLTIESRVKRIEEFLNATHGTEFYA
jgi:hypothetical protein